MIDEDRTMEKYGYYSTDLKPQSNKYVVAVCDDCETIRYLKKCHYSDLCVSCSHKGERNYFFGKKHTLETRLIIGKSSKERRHTEKTKLKMSKSQEGRHHTEETKLKLSIINTGKKRPPHTDETRQHMSATGQGIPYEDWTGFSDKAQYCEKFDEACRERIRAKYGRRCFLCGKPQDENITKTNKPRALSVHHFDMNKDAGCNGNAWKLVPLCMCCHGGTHSKMWQARIEYLLKWVWIN